VKFDAVAANNDEMAIGAIFGMQQAGVDPKTKCVGGIDATADALDRMEGEGMVQKVGSNLWGLTRW